MATIGFDALYYSKITEDANGDETYGEVKKLAKGISADLAIEPAEATLYADDAASEVVKRFRDGTLTLNVDDLSIEVLSDLTGSKVDDKGVLVSASEDMGSYVALGFRAAKASGAYRYFWFYKVRFGIPGVSLATTGESVTFNTPTLAGSILRRNKVATNGEHPWKVEITSGVTGADAETIDAWFDAVPEPEFAA